LKANANRLSTPYDLHITLRHILNLSVNKRIPLKAVGCPHCRSLFEEIPECRRCKDAGIQFNSCPCLISKLSISKKVIKFAAEFAVKALNQKLQTIKAANGEKCAAMNMTKVTEANEQRSSLWNVNYIIRFTAMPSKAQFEAFMRRKLSTLISMTPKFELVQEIVHINENSHPMCVPESGVVIVKKLNDETDYGDYEENEEL
jgi:hypothetical protein